MFVNRVDLEVGTVITNYSIPNGTEAERLALTVSGGEQFYQTDGTVGTYNYVDGAWSIISNPNTISITGGADNYFESILYTFTISNYNSVSTYSGVTVGDGSATIMDDVITYVADSSAGSDTMIITQDGISVSFNITVETPPPAFANIFTTLDRSSTHAQRGYAICTDSSKNTYTIVEDTSTNPDDRHVVKCDKDGAVVWQQKYTASNSFSVNISGIASDGTNVYVTTTEKVVLKGGITKLDAATGNTIWQYEYSDASSVTDIVLDGTNLYIVGSTATGTILFANISATDGTVIWAKTFAATAIIPTGAVKSVSLYNGDLYGLSEETIGDPSALIYKVDAIDGTLGYITSLTKNGKNINPESITVDSTGIYVVGSLERPANISNISIVRLTLDGSTLSWAKGFRHPSGSGASTTYYGVTLTSNGVYSVGHISGNRSASALDPILTKFDKSDGTVGYHNLLTATQNSVYREITSSDDEIIITGYVNAGNQDALVLQNNDDGVSLTGTLPNHALVSFSTPALTDDSPDLTPVVTLRGTQTDSALTFTRTATTYTAVVTNLTAVTSSY